MAIHVSDRNLSRLEYEDLYRELYREMRQKMMRIPKRRRDTVARPVLEKMNAAWEAILGIEEDPVRGTKHAAGIRMARIIEAQKKIKETEPAIWVWWSICTEDEDMKAQDWRKRQRICDRFNRILQLLHDMQKAGKAYNPEKDRGITQMRYYTESEIENAVFLRKLRELHRMTHTKHIRMSQSAKDAESGLIVRLVNTAWYCAVRGNQLKTYIPEEAEQRRQYFSIAVRCLRKAERPLFDLFDFEGFSNREMREWAELLNESVRLLTAVREGGGKADR